MDDEFTRYYIKIRTIMEIDPKTIYEVVATPLGPNAPAYRTIAKWAKRFHEGREDVNDEPRFGRSVSEVTDETPAGDVSASTGSHRCIAVLRDAPELPVVTLSCF
jgi:hypothetical protein